MKPVVSIIIPTYNRSRFLEQAIESIISQTYKDWECIIVDDGSTDHTEGMVQTYREKDPRFSFYHRPALKKKGPSSCRNFGFEKSKGSLITWFDDDDIMLPTAIEKRVSLFSEGVDGVICKLQHWDYEKDEVLGETRLFSENPIEDYLIGSILFFVSGPVWKKSFLMQQTELFDENLTNLDDWDFNLRMLYCKPKIIFLDENLIKYRVHTDSLSQAIEKLDFTEIKSEFKARLKHLSLLNFYKIDSGKYKKFVIARNKFYLREALVKDDESIYFLFKTLVNFQLNSFQIKDMILSATGFLSYRIMGKGYFLFK